MDGKVYTTHSYKLRSAGPNPVQPGQFIVQTFGVDKNEINNYEASTTLPESDDFMGADVDASLMSANFQRLPYFDARCVYLFSGQTVGKTEFIDESEMPGG